MAKVIERLARPAIFFAGALELLTVATGCATQTARRTSTHTQPTSTPPVPTSTCTPDQLGQKIGAAHKNHVVIDGSGYTLIVPPGEVIAIESDGSPTVAVTEGGISSFLNPITGERVIVLANETHTPETVELDNLGAPISATVMTVQEGANVAVGKDALTVAGDVATRLHLPGGSEVITYDVGGRVPVPVADDMLPATPAVCTPPECVPTPPPSGSGEGGSTPTPVVTPQG